MEHFDLSQILFLRYEELSQNPYSLLNEISTFLEIDPFPKDLELIKYNVSKKKVKPKSYLKKFNRVLNSIYGHKLKRKLKNIDLIRRLYYVPAYKEEQLDIELENKIKAFFKKDMEKFAEVSGIHYKLD